MGPSVHYQQLSGIHWLRAAHKHQWLPLELVGDSRLILRQLMKYSKPRNSRLAALYAEARRLADRLGVHKWHHHLGACDKMADAAANAAMDSRASSQLLHPTTRVQHAELAHHLGFDFAHWQAHYIARLLVQ
jgi:ribonuclease HI